MSQGSLFADGKPVVRMVEPVYAGVFITREAFATGGSRYHVAERFKPGDPPSDWTSLSTHPSLKAARRAAARFKPDKPSKPSKPDKPSKPRDVSRPVGNRPQSLPEFKRYTLKTGRAPELFGFHVAYEHKADADKEAKALRRDGVLVRVVKYPGGYAVYTRGIGKAAQARTKRARETALENDTRVARSLLSSGPKTWSQIGYALPTLDDTHPSAGRNRVNDALSALKAEKVGYRGGSEIYALPGWKDPSKEARVWPNERMHDGKTYLLRSEPSGISYQDARERVKKLRALGQDVIGVDGAPGLGLRSAVYVAALDERDADRGMPANLGNPSKILPACLSRRRKFDGEVYTFEAYYPIRLDNPAISAARTAGAAKAAALRYAVHARKQGRWARVLRFGRRGRNATGGFAVFVRGKR